MLKNIPPVLHPMRVFKDSAPRTVVANWDIKMKRKSWIACQKDLTCINLTNVALAANRNFLKRSLLKKARRKSGEISLS